MNISPLKARWELRKTVGIHGGCKSQTLHPLGFLLCTENPGVEKAEAEAFELTIRFTAWFRGFLGVPRMTLFVPLKEKTQRTKKPSNLTKKTHALTFKPSAKIQISRVFLPPAIFFCFPTKFSGRRRQGRRNFSLLPAKVPPAGSILPKPCGFTVVLHPSSSPKQCQDDRVLVATGWLFVSY